MAPGALPWVGHALSVRRDPLGFMDSMTGSYPILRFHLYGRELLMVCCPELTTRMLRDDRTFDKGGPVAKLVQPLVGDGLATCPHSRHRAYRRAIQPVVAPDLLPVYIQNIASVVTMVTDQWEPEQPLDVMAQMRRMALHAGMRTWLPTFMSPAAIDNLADDLTSVLVGFARQLGRPHFIDRLPLSGSRARSSAMTRIREALTGGLSRWNPNARSESHLVAALSTNPNDLHTIDSEVIIDHAATFVAASTATVASVMGWVWHLLAQNQTIEERLHHEVDTAMRTGPLEYGLLSQLPLVRNIITETLRMYPSLWLGTRVATAHTQLGAYKIPAGTVLAYSPYIVGRSYLYKHPGEFLPERWDPDRGQVPPRHSFVPFGGGARQCIAIQYAPAGMALILAAVAARWRLTPVSGHPLTPRAAANLTPRSLRMYALPRQGHSRASTGFTGQASHTRAGTRRPTNRNAWIL
ncbi:cytochrome P450 [Streptomyces lavendulae]